MTTRWIGTIFGGMALAVTVLAQEPGAVVIHKEIRTVGGGLPHDVIYQEAGPVTMGFIGAEMSFSDKAVKGAPYAAEAVTETTQTLNDGNHITRKSTASVYRDSQGRTRREETMGALGPWAAGGDSPRTVFINDPVTGVGYHLDPQARVAHKLTLGNNTFVYSNAGTPGAGDKTFTFERAVPPPQGGAGVALAMPGMKIARADAKTESLGKQTIEGVQAEGTRSTMTIPAGTIGNELPIASTSERWYSAELQTVVMSKRSDPRFGDTVYRLTNIQRGEQAPALFDVPSDYTIKDDAAMMNEKLNHERKLLDEAK